MEKSRVQHGKLSSQQLRKIKKPLIERRRRERINESLNQLKALVLDAMNKEESRYNKMEKADILEMTVKHLKEARRLSMPLTIAREDTNVLGKYRSGFAECAQEVGRYLSSFVDMPGEIRTRVMGHLSECAADKVTSHITFFEKSRTTESSVPLVPTSLLSPGIEHRLVGTDLNTADRAHVQNMKPVLPADHTASETKAYTVTTLQTAPLLLIPAASAHQQILQDAIPLYQTGSYDDKCTGSISKTMDRLKHIKNPLVTISGIGQITGSKGHDHCFLSSSPNALELINKCWESRVQKSESNASVLERKYINEHSAVWRPW